MQHKVLKSPHPILTEAVEKHIHRLWFTPALAGKCPVRSWVNIPFRFRLVN